MNKRMNSTQVLKSRIQPFGCLILLLFLVASGVVKAQQEPMYSQYMFNMTQINPAYVGNRAVNNITALGRKQWIQVAGAPLTSVLTWDRRAEGSNVGYGIQIYDDRLGVESSTGVKAFYSYRIPMNGSFLSFGISAGAMNYQADFTKTNPTTGGDPLFQGIINGFLPTAGFGMLYGSRNFYAGLSTPSLLNTKIDLTTSQITVTKNNHYFLTAGYIFDVSDIIKLKPSILGKGVMGAPIEFDFNLNMWILDIIGLGVSYRTNDAIVGIFELQISPEFRLGYAYDYPISTLNYWTKQTHELMIRYEFANSKTEKILSPRYY